MVRRHFSLDYIVVATDSHFLNHVRRYGIRRLRVDYLTTIYSNYFFTSVTYLLFCFAIPLFFYFSKNHVSIVEVHTEKH